MTLNICFSDNLGVYAFDKYLFVQTFCEIADYVSDDFNKFLVSPDLED